MKLAIIATLVAGASAFVGPQKASVSICSLRFTDNPTKHKYLTLSLG